MLCVNYMGNFPKDLKLGVVNFENFDYARNNCSNGGASLYRASKVSQYWHKNCQNYFQPYHISWNISSPQISNCFIPDILCRFIAELKENFVVEKFHKSTDKARQDVTHGKSIGYLIIGRNFSSYLQDRLSNNFEVDYDISDDEVIQVFLDQSNYQLTKFAQNAIYAAYDDFTEKIKEECNRKYNSETIPVSIKHIYGNLSDDFGKALSIGGVIT